MKCIICRDGGLPAGKAIVTLERDGLTLDISQIATFVGIDVSHDRLEVHVVPGDHAFTLDNGWRGAWQLVNWLSEYEDVLVVLEATGGLQDEIAAVLAAAGHVVVVVDPRRIRDFARALSLLAKGDLGRLGPVPEVLSGTQPARIRLAYR